MALKKSEKRLLIVLGVVIVAVIISQLVSKKEGKETKTNAASEKSLTGQNDTVTSSVTQKKTKQFSYKSGKKKFFENWGDNPFSLSSQQQKKIEVVSKDTAKTESKVVLPKHKFLGIFIAEGKKYALIDDLVIAEGEIKEGIQVLRIEDKKVIYKEQGKIFTLYWSE